MLTIQEAYKKLDSIIQTSIDHNAMFDEEYDLQMFAFIIDHKKELEDKGYKIDYHTGAFGYSYIFVTI